MDADVIGGIALIAVSVLCVIPSGVAYVCLTLRSDRDGDVPRR